MTVFVKYFCTHSDMNFGNKTILNSFAGSQNDLGINATLCCILSISGAHPRQWLAAAVCLYKEQMIQELFLATFHSRVYAENIQWGNKGNVSAGSDSWWEDWVTLMLGSPDSFNQYLTDETKSRTTYILHIFFMLHVCQETMIFSLMWMSLMIAVKHFSFFTKTLFNVYVQSCTAPVRWYITP